ncbi:hypothetical protein FRUB_05240 [Fimbriiglobus ruber]|uniref:Uncharacterized protein n=1 Tax=Fimbriiglobus ruber TaxID=1908690 RepID=A0A225DFI2_9BACT|nr:hypothetical protein FRUB_05240 [Fimbriiglobus ruber]
MPHCAFSRQLLMANDERPNGREGRIAGGVQNSAGSTNELIRHRPPTLQVFGRTARFFRKPGSDKSDGPRLPARSCSLHTVRRPRPPRSVSTTARSAGWSGMLSSVAKWARTGP